MMMILDPTYTLRIEIRDKISNGSIGTVAAQFNDATPVSLHKWFNSMTGKTGCDEVLAAVKDALAKAGIANATVSLESFAHK